MPKKQLLGIAGSLILFIGTFLPIIRVPIVGDMNYFQNGRGDGIIIIVLAGFSLLFIWAEMYSLLWFTGLGSLGLLAFTFFNIQSRLDEVRSQMKTELANNPFKGLGDAMMQSIQLQWGWAILVIGAGLLITAAALKAKIEEQPQEQS